MNNILFRTIGIVAVLTVGSIIASGQQVFVITGQVADAARQPVQNASVHLKGIPGGVMTKPGGTFALRTATWSDTLEITCTGFEKLSIGISKTSATGISVQLKPKAETLQAVSITAKMMDKEPGKRFMKKVIARKVYNNPDRFGSYSYQQYKRHELDLIDADSSKKEAKGLRKLMVNVYRSVDTANAASAALPIYFSETISNIYHSLSPPLNKENVIAKKTLGLETDKILKKLDKFNFSFNVYDDWFPIFSQTYASPLSNTAFDYYNFYFSDSSLVNGSKVYKIHFSPKQSFERAFAGTLWINDTTFSISKIEMNLSKSANLNFVDNIRYTQEYKSSLDSATGKYEYMPFKYTSTVDFETGAALIGLPASTNAAAVHLAASNTTVVDHLKLNTDMTGDVVQATNTEVTADLEKPDSYWQKNRSDSLTGHEKSIYLMTDSIKNNRTYKRDTKIITALAIGYYDFGNLFRFGPLTSLVSSNNTEGLRTRVGLQTLPGISKKLNINSYIAYGTKDKKIKGGLGFKYLWNSVRWSKTSLLASADYDFLLDKDDELDDDNLLTSSLRKNIPITSVFTKIVILKHEQSLARNITLKASIDYKELVPVFNFSYHPISKATDLPVDTAYASKLPVAEATIGIRYSKGDQFTILNYDKIRLIIYQPVFTLSYTYGIEAGLAQFSFNKIDAGIEHRLRLPPKALFYYNVSAGKTFGTVPYLLLNVPPGNPSYVDSKYYFNTMLPYEYAADQYVSLHTKVYLGGLLFDNIPLLNRLGWRERLSFNMHMGSMTAANRAYNNNSSFTVADKTPFTEAGAGIENIFHLISIDYFRRLSGYNSSLKKRGALFLGLKVAFSVHLAAGSMYLVPGSRIFNQHRCVTPINFITTPDRFFLNNLL